MAAFAGTVTSSETDPAVHGTVAGNPEAESAGATVNLHVVAVPPTTADSETLPPDEGRADGDAAKPETVGAADASVQGLDFREGESAHALDDDGVALVEAVRDLDVGRVGASRFYGSAQEPFSVGHVDEVAFHRAQEGFGGDGRRFPAVESVGGDLPGF